MPEMPAFALNSAESEIFSVSGLSRAVKTAIEGNFAHVRVRGEVSGFKLHASGHAYFSLKDKDCALDAVMWKGTKTSVPIQDGMELVASGKITAYGARSKYQMVVARAEPEGQGALLKLLRERQASFQKEGLFDRKRPLPKFPKTVGVITSPTGAVIRDILHRIADRFPCDVLLWPVLVQGNGSAEQVAAAIKGFDNLPAKPDVLIVARGGGSLEDLWSFNDEAVVRATATCGIPIVSAIGHETDFTLIDFAADARAPTPTAAAELITPDRRHLNVLLKELDAKINRSFSRMTDFFSLTLKLAIERIPDLGSIILEKAQKTDDRGERLIQAVKSLIDRGESALSATRIPPLSRQMVFCENALASGFKNFTRAALSRFDDMERSLKWHGMVLAQNSYRRALEKGFCLLSAGDKVIGSAADTRGVSEAELVFHDGGVAVNFPDSAR